MTRWGFIADVHGNLTALRRAIDQFGANGAEHLVYLGDLLGRGNSDACVELVRATATYSVVGNRDRDWADRVAPASRAYVLSLPSLASASDFVAVHGDPRLHPALNTADPQRAASLAPTPGCASTSVASPSGVTATTPGSGAKRVPTRRSNNCVALGPIYRISRKLFTW